MAFPMHLYFPVYVHIVRVLDLLGRFTSDLEAEMLPLCIRG
jgi:hypothetical protein